MRCNILGRRAGSIIEFIIVDDIFPVPDKTSDGRRLRRFRRGIVPLRMGESGKDGLVDLLGFRRAGKTFKDEVTDAIKRHGRN